MKKTVFVWSALVAAFGLGLATYFWRTGAFPISQRISARASQVDHRASAARADVPPLPAVPAPTLRDRLAALLEQLRHGGVIEAELALFRQDLLTADPAQTIPQILAFLADGGDARTGQDFAIRRGGEVSAPTLRVLLMDVLGQLARRTGSDAAAKLARETLATKSSADEWAIALRNTAWHDPKDTAFLATKTREMLAWPAWRSDPPAALLEAFDVIVFTRDATFVADLAAAQNDPQSELQHAASVALDRLAEASPLEVMTFLNTHPATLAERPLLRADYYAKADLSQPAQKSALEIYLGRPDITAAEKAKLLQALAAPGSFISQNLLTTPPPAADDRQREQAIVAVTREWLAAGRFPELRPQILALQQRAAGE